MPPYRGRFAPSPTGPLHFGSLVAAAGSYLDAKHHGGDWLVRIEDIDTPRVVEGSAENILATLKAFGMIPDEKIVVQSERKQSYHQALHKLRSLGVVYPCACSRKEIADSALNSLSDGVYPGCCRNGLTDEKKVRSLRLRTTKETISFCDLLQGNRSSYLEVEVGDFVIYRHDGIFAYQLAVVVDDAEQGITHIVRGADLVDSTPRQIYIQRLLNLPKPDYLHLPIAINSQGQKLSKQTMAKPVESTHSIPALVAVLKFLNQDPPSNNAKASLNKLWDWAISHWDRNKLPKAHSQKIPDVD